MDTTRFKVQLAPDGKRHEVVDPATLHLFGSFWTREEAEDRVEELAAPAMPRDYILPPTRR